MDSVVITGIGALSPLGATFSSSWETLCQGWSGTTLVRGDRQPTAGVASDFDESRFFPAREMRRLDRFAQMAVAASLMAAEDSGLSTDPGNSHLPGGGVIIGSSRGGITRIEEAVFALSAAARAGRRILSPYLMPSTTISMAASYTAQRLGIRGYSLGISNACASGTNAIGEAFRLIRSGFTGPVFAGGAEAPLSRICIEGYAAAGALSRQTHTHGPMPFSAGRDGFVLSEGACVLVLERLDHALARGAPIYAEIAGYGNSVDAFHQTQPSVAGELKAMHLALASAGLSPADIDLICAHGTGTRLGDAVEAEAISALLDGNYAETPVCALKAATGHMLAASGAFETACAAMALHDGMIPPTAGRGDPDPDIGLNIPAETVSADLRSVLVNSFGFGGVNAVLALKRSPHLS